MNPTPPVPAIQASRPVGPMTRGERIKAALRAEQAITRLRKRAKGKKRPPEPGEPEDGGGFDEMA